MSVYTNQTNANATKSYFAPISGGGGGGGSNFPGGATLGVPNLGGAVYGVSTMVTNFNSMYPGGFYDVARYNYNPPNVNLNDQVAMVITYNPQSAGQTALALGAKGTGAAFVGAVWEGYITMPLDLWGQDINMYSDNETFFKMTGAAGAIGSISTGVGFLSGSNLFSSIRAPTGSNANMTALLSTLQSTYPSCFS